MPTNKNALYRIKLLDNLLSDRTKGYTLEKLTEKLEKEFKVKVKRRTIEDDLSFMKDFFDAPIEGEWDLESNKDKGYDTYQKVFHYSDPSFSIFKKKLTAEEKDLLKQVLGILGQFDGVPELEGLEQLKKAADFTENDEQSAAVISVAQNPNGSSPWFGMIYSAALNRQVLNVGYHRFGEGENARQYVAHPYLLKEYNRRWFLICRTEAVGEDKEMIRTLPLDRIDEVSVCSKIDFVPYDGDIRELFDDVIGMTLHENEKAQEILFWVSDGSMGYVETKPLHDSQKRLKLRDAELRSKYPMLEGGAFYTIKCRRNYELIRELTLFGDELLVLESEAGVREDVEKRISDMAEAYAMLKK